MLLFISFVFVWIVILAFVSAVWTIWDILSTVLCILALILWVGTFVAVGGIL